MIAASRFEGGLPLQLGFALVFVAFGGAIAIVLLTVQLERTTTRSFWPFIVAIPALGSIASLWLPAYEGVLRGTGQLRVETGWTGLDPVSTSTVVVMTALLFVPRVHPALVVGAAASQAGILAGNWVIQFFTDRPTSIRYGLGVSAAFSLCAVALATVGVRGRRMLGR